MDYNGVSPHIKVNVRISAIDKASGKEEIIGEGHNTLCEAGIGVLAKAAAGKDEYISHMGALFNTGGATSFTKTSTYTDFISAGGTLKQMPILLHDFRDYNATSANVHKDNVLEMQSVFVEPNTGGGDTLRSTALLYVSPNGVQTMVAVYNCNINKPANQHLSVTWSILYTV